jgi:hypothetical protein
LRAGSTTDERCVGSSALGVTGRCTPVKVLSTLLTVLFVAWDAAVPGVALRASVGSEFPAANYAQRGAVRLARGLHALTKYGP